MNLPLWYQPNLCWCGQVSDPNQIYRAVSDISPNQYKTHKNGTQKESELQQRSWSLKQQWEERSANGDGGTSPGVDPPIVFSTGCSWSVCLFISFSLLWCTIALLRRSICSSFKASVKLLCYRTDGATRRSNLIYPVLERVPINSLSIEPIDYWPSSLQKNYVHQRTEIHMIGNSSSLLSPNSSFQMSPYKAVDWKPQRRLKELMLLE